MNTQGITEEKITARMLVGVIDRDEAIRQIRAEEAGDIPEHEIVKKTSAGLSRAQAIEVIKAQRADDERQKSETEQTDAAKDRPDLFTTERFEELVAERKAETAENSTLKLP